MAAIGPEPWACAGEGLGRSLCGAALTLSTCVHGSLGHPAESPEDAGILAGWEAPTRHTHSA